MTPIRVLIADDHPAIVKALTLGLKEEGVECVGFAHLAGDVVAEYDRSTPDVVVLDIQFGPGETGLNVISELLKAHPNVRVVFYSQFDQVELVSEAYRLGAHAFVPKKYELEVLAESIRQVHEGRTYFLPEVANRLALMSTKGTDSPRSKLDARELVVFTYLAEGLLNQEIADKLNLHSKTIGLIRQAIEDKLGVKRPAELTLLAVRYRIINIE